MPVDSAASKTAATVPPRRGRGRPVGDREGRRTELLDAAMKVIADEGFAGMSLRKVAQRAGCTTGAVSYYFASKDEMLVAVIESRFDEFDKLLEIGDGAGAIRAMFERWLEITNPEDPGVWVAGFQLLAYARHEPTLAAAYQRRYARYRETFAAILAGGQRDGWVRRDIPADLLADQLSAMGDGWMMLFPIEPDRFGPKRVKALLDATMAMISPAA
ncbi:MAG: TetR family transcriptional regulator C-terminal domain-containing protein [Phenylobacterium sp.]|uniref:TetR/AcrR family transcriptional regulator n=1 Tax=Phenylobacterium sp. TaxID=1871053 RepID=UPI001A50DA43|nr:TetR family transcriptional regulator C-terminal domain-containing protein [Phenylobacterium sp.]MBL8554561.1 TetR family transcriptional regulator C-terminal domain-containing protein [Phenylobacterium sp.]